MSQSGGHGHFIIPQSTYIRTFLALLVLTVVTVLVSFVPMGVLNVPVALLVAGLKAALVVSFFMGLKYDNKVNIFIAVSMVVFVGIFLLFTLIDMSTRNMFSDETGYVQSTQELSIEEKAFEDRQASLQSLTVPPLTPADTARVAGSATVDSTTAPVPDETPVPDEESGNEDPPGN